MTTKQELDEMIAKAKSALYAINPDYVPDYKPNHYKQTDWTLSVDNTLRDICALSTCSNPLPFSFGAGRIANYCSNACKQKAYRQRNKALRIAAQNEKPLRISKRAKNTDLLTAGKQIGVSGTVHKFPLPQLTKLHSPAPVIRSFDDLKLFFGG